MTELPTGRLTLVDLLQHRAQQQPDRLAYRLLSDGRPAGTLNYGELHDACARIGAQLAAAAPPGSRVMLVYPQDLDYIRAFYGAWYAGLVPVPAYPPELARPQRSIRRLMALVRDAQPALVLTSAWVLRAIQPVLKQLPELAAVRWIATDTLNEAPPPGWLPASPASGELAFLQYTSGSTASPRGVMLTHANLTHNMADIARRWTLNDRTNMAFWLPLYHDMGLIGKMLMAAYLGVEATFMSPVDFLKSPARWLQAISDYRPFISGGPNFGYALCTRKVTDEQLEGLDLSSWKVAFNGAEPVQAHTLEAFARRFEGAGFNPRAFAPCYGLAEGTLAVALSTVQQGHHALSVDPEALSAGRLVPREDGLRLVASGPVLGDLDLRIVDPEFQQDLPADRVGEIWVSGGSIARSYWRERSPETFAGALRDKQEFMRTGDLGFMHQGLSYCCGRIKDLIIVRGSNHYPQDFEVAVEGCHPQLRAGTAVAFGEGGGPAGERVCVVVELRGQLADIAPIWRAARKAVAEASGVGLGRLVLVRPGAVPKTSSGKIQRASTRRALEEGTLKVLAQAGHDAHAVAPASREALAALLCELTGCTPQDLAQVETLDELGLDSVQRVELQEGLERMMGGRVSAAALAGVETLAELEALTRQTPAAQRTTATAAPRQDVRGLDVVLYNFKPIRVSPELDQAQLLSRTADWLAQATGKPEAARAAVKRFGVSPNIIKRRQFTLVPDPSGRPQTHPEASAPAGLPLGERMALYRGVVDRVAAQAWADRSEPPDEVIHVSCSGYMSPSPVQVWASQQGWSRTSVTHSYHMGCYGAFPAVRMASGFLSSAAALRPGQPWTVDVLHSELLSAHLDLTRMDPGDIVTATLFADGFVRYSLGRQAAVAALGQRGLRVLAYREELVPDSTGEMTWDLEAHQFHMYLSRGVPLFLREVIEGFVTGLCADAGLSFEQQREHLAYALHPGGARIVDFLRDQLKLTEAQVAASRRVLLEHGNMSSATLPHVWAELIDDPTIPVGTRVLSLAFGPGLTAAGLILEKV